MAHKSGPPWREAPDSGGGNQRRVIVAFHSRRTVGAKKTTQQPTALGTRKYQVFTEGRGTTHIDIAGTILWAIEYSFFKYGPAAMVLQRVRLVTSDTASVEGAWTTLHL